MGAVVKNLPPCAKQISIHLMRSEAPNIQFITHTYIIDCIQKEKYLKRAAIHFSYQGSAPQFTLDR